MLKKARDARQMSNGTIGCQSLYYILIFVSNQRQKKCYYVFCFEFYRKRPPIKMYLLCIRQDLDLERLTGSRSLYVFLHSQYANSLSQNENSLQILGDSGDVIP